jgi:hypothetical protein
MTGVRQTPGGGVFSAEGARRVGNLLGAAQPHRIHQGLAHPPGGANGEFGVSVAEFCIVGGVDEVAMQGEFQRAGEAGAMDFGDDGFGAGAHRLHDPAGGFVKH